MNKKFSTLFAGGLLVSAMAVAQGTIDPASLQRVTTFASGKTYLVVQDVNKDGVIDATDALLGVTADRDGNLTYANVCNTFTNATAEESAYVWKVSEVKGVAGTYHYSFYNAEAGAYLAFDATTGDLVVKADDAQPDKSKVYFAINSTATLEFNCAGSSLLSTWQGGPNALDILAGGPLNADYEKFILCEYTETGLTKASVLNAEMGGAGFAFEFKDDSKVEQNIFKDQVLKAFYVSADIAIETGYSIPEGMYFATEYPASLASKDVISGRTAFADFKECTFIAVDPTANKDIHQAPRANGLGFALTTVSGADMNFYTVASTDVTYNANQTSSDDEVYVGNACFTVTEKDPMRNAGAYVLSVSPRVQTDATKTAHAQKSVEVGVIKDQNVSYLMTVAAGAGQALTAGAGTKYDVTELLSTEGPSIYTIQFVSGNEDETSDDTKEYGLYLTTQTGAFIATPNGRSEDPLYQFVITAVDEDNNTVTFANRQTQKSLTVTLFELDEDNTYTVQGTTTNFKYAKVDEDGVYELSANTKLAGTKVLLTKVETVDKYATFLNHEDPASTVTIEFATRADADERLYLAAEYKNNKYTNKLIASEDEVSQWFLNKEDRKFIANAFVYLKNDKVVTSELVKDSVVYFTYTMKQAIDEDENPKDISNVLNRLYTGATGTSPQKFIVKENADGSVSIIPAAQLTSNVVYAYNKESAPFKIVAYYDWAAAANTAVKTFIVGEPAGLSLEAKTQWVNMESVQGGFINANADNDAVIAIKEVAEEALTLRLDTTDSEHPIPHFYISKVGANADQRLYLYNAEDSTDVALSSTAQNKYTFGDCTKLIFKEGALVGSDTIATTVNGKLVNVAAKANVLNGTLRGIDNFKYQIVKSDLASDDYLIRQGIYYVCNLNGMLTIAADRKNALHVTIEEVASPTANEAVAAAEVSVVAVNGAIIVKGAAGKVVTVANILGQTIANQVAASDNVTIAAPAGIAVVTVDGEATKVVVK